MKVRRSLTKRGKEERVMAQGVGCGEKDEEEEQQQQQQQQLRISGSLLHNECNVQYHRCSLPFFRRGIGAGDPSGPLAAFSQNVTAFDSYKRVQYNLVRVTDHCR
ncbi:hypothetical protein PHSY_001301 [Pseudozyma hubeiensis SY62]|uniref:Uncharacterized protein n=1 Tax=Pseudozyma hubeiensis (strain SY62) TaxID=1305764 RepID=R9NYH9_PSEHS|nr:hypothetical protein PHSY_001301 [Pseudozyma hubeiensis SY62]GAC93736.1 hypothetical protein PHSY_001301 [Pseudozyma hubeiensis SY62]